MKEFIRQYKLTIGGLSLLLAVILGVMFYFAHTALQKESMNDAQQTLESVAQSIDNIMLGVEQASGNIYLDMVMHLDEPERMETYCQRLVECDPDIAGCMIAFKPGYYPGRELTMSYVHRNRDMNALGRATELVAANTFTERPYTEQRWFTGTMEKKTVNWLSLKGDQTEEEPLVAFCLPIFDRTGESVGVMAVTVPTVEFSDIVLAARPSEHAYCALIDRYGTFIVNPDTEKLSSLTPFAKNDGNVDYRLLETIEMMTAGMSGSKTFSRDGQEWRAFFKPFQREKMQDRAESDLGWSVAVVFPESDVNLLYYTMFFIVVLIAVIGMALFVILSRWAIRKRLTKKPTLTIALMAVPVYVLSLGLLYNQSRYLLHQESIEYANSILDTALYRITNYMRTIETATNANAWMLEDDLTPENIENISNRIVNLNHHVLSNSVFIKPRTLDQYKNRFSVYTVNQGDTVVTFVEPEFDYLNRLFYTLPMESGKACWVDPFTEYTEGRIDQNQAIASYCRPLKNEDNGVIIGVTTSDLAFNKLDQVISSDLKRYPGSFFVMLNKEGRYLMHIDPTRVFRKSIFTDVDPTKNADIIKLGRQMISRQEGAVHIEYRGERYHVIYKPIPDSEWSLALACPDSDFFDGFSK